ncbi:hydroxyethylthiazole kinase [Sporolactobacillus sp. Y61]|uniref:Hydroxyethylthiazole kinase n=1 Tax=Sporolactobacillus sp. Y61 TaxID=3160863 RepID=A0AAU8II33_9BACL
MISAEKLYHGFLKIREERPLIHHITNAVTINDCANATLAVGASPVMADSPDETADMAAQASALVLNIGTLTEMSITAMIRAGQSANRCQVPVVFDPVGAGATPFRRQTVFRILDAVHPDIICGNMSEIKVLAGMKARTRGVDAGDRMDHAGKIARDLARRLGSVIAITGAADAVSDGRRTFILHNGVARLASVTGTGCMTDSLIAAFAGVLEDRLEAAVCGIMTMGLSGEKAEALLADADGIGTFKVRLFDAFSTLDAHDFSKGSVEDVRAKS